MKETLFPVLIFLTFNHSFAKDHKTQVSELKTLLKIKSFLENGGSTSYCDGSFEGVACNEMGQVMNISLQEKGLFGKLAPEIGELKGLDLHFNGLHKEIAELTQLTDLYLNVNNLSGEIPVEFEKMANLQAQGINNRSQPFRLSVEPAVKCKLPKVISHQIMISRKRKSCINIGGLDYLHKYNIRQASLAIEVVGFMLEDNLNVDIDVLNRILETCHYACDSLVRVVLMDEIKPKEITIERKKCLFMKMNKPKVAKRLLRDVRRFDIDPTTDMYNAILEDTMPNKISRVHTKKQRHR